jgi:hypothetical protein
VPSEVTLAAATDGPLSSSSHRPGHAADTCRYGCLYQAPVIGAVKFFDASRLSDNSADVNRRFYMAMGSRRATLSGMVIWLGLQRMRARISRRLLGGPPARRKEFPGAKHSLVSGTRVHHVEDLELISDELVVRHRTVPVSIDFPQHRLGH